MGDIGPDVGASQRASLPSPNPTKSFWQTSHPNRLVNHRSTQALPSTVDVLVIGSGITSVFAVRELLTTSNDLKVLVLEARTTCSGATGRNGGHMQPIVHEQEPHIIDFELRTFKEVDASIQKHNIPCDFRKLSGCVGFWKTTYFEEAKKALAKSRQIDPKHSELVEVIEGADQLRELRLQGAVGAIIQSAAASLSPYKLVIWMWQDLLARYPDRLNLQTNTAATTISQSPELPAATTVHTPRGSVNTEHVIVCTNGYASYLLPEFDGIITPTQGQMSASVPHGTYSAQLLPYSYGFLGVGKQDRVMSDYLVQAPLSSGGHLMYGGGRAYAHNEGVGVSDDSYVEPLADEYLRKLPARLDLASPANASSRDNADDSKELDMISSWTGIMGYSKDHFPWVGAVPDRRRVWISAGYTGHGMTNAPGCGLHVARLVVAADEGRDWREVENEALHNRHLPKDYVVTRSRLAAAACR